MSLDEFIYRIDGFLDLPPAKQIPLLGFYLLFYKEYHSYTASDIMKCFEYLNIPPYSNISSYLSREKSAKRMVKCKDGGYALSRKVYDEISYKINNSVPPKPSSELFPLDIFEDTRDYIKKTAVQAVVCYDNQAYDACLVMIRRLIETLIIETFEYYNVQDRIKTSNGNYMYCSDLIDELLKETHLWTIGRNSIKELPKIKQLGDNCAHNRRFNARKTDIDNIKIGLRIVLEELVHLVRY